MYCCNFCILWVHELWGFGSGVKADSIPVRILWCIKGWSDPRILKEHSDLTGCFRRLPQFVHPSEHHKGPYSCCSWRVHFSLKMEAHKFCRMANQPIKTKCKNNYCESKCNLHVYLGDMFKKASQEFLYIKCCGISWSFVSYSIPFFSYEDFRKHRRGPWWTWTSRWSRFPIWIQLRLLTQPKYRSRNRKLSVIIYISIDTAWQSRIWDSLAPVWSSVSHSNWIMLYILQ